MVLLKDIDGVPSVPGNDVFSRRQQATVFVLTCAIPMTSYCKGDMRAFNGNKPTKQSKREQKMLLAREEERECYYEHVPVPEDKVAYGDKLRYALCNITPHTHTRMHAPSLYCSIPYTSLPRISWLCTRVAHHAGRRSSAWQRRLTGAFFLFFF